MRQNQSFLQSDTIKSLAREILKLYWWNLTKEVWRNLRERPDNGFPRVADSISLHNIETKILFIRYSTGGIQLLAAWNSNAFRHHRALSRVSYGEDRPYSDCILCVQLTDPTDILGVSYLNLDDAVRFAAQLPRTFIVESPHDIRSVKLPSVGAVEINGLNRDDLYDWMLERLNYLADRPGLLPGPSEAWSAIKELRNKSRLAPDGLSKKLDRLWIPAALCVQLGKLWGEADAADLFAVALVLTHCMKGPDNKT